MKRAIELGALLALAVAAAHSCGAIPDYRTLTQVDLHPPVFEGIRTLDERTLLLSFDEEVRALPGATRLRPALGVSGVEARDSQLLVHLSASQELGAAYTLETAVEDVGRNSTSLLAPFYGYNPSVPAMVINEFTTQGSSTHPDVVELAVLSSGNTAGVCLYEGMPSNWDDRKVLPPIAVGRGDYLVVHFKPQGLSDELDEAEAADRSGGIDASPSAYDLWVQGGDGLSGNNGVLALYACPDGQILDAVLYSNRTSASDSDYAGFGTRDVYDQVLALEKTGAWRSSGDHLAPEDAIDPDPSTATRSISRSSASDDSDAASDWHITPTSGATFGAANGDEVYVP